MKKPVGLVKAICGGLIIGLPAIPLAVKAQFTSTLDKVNPCPGIYYVEPFNSTRVAPQGCPPNAASQRTPVGQVPDRAVIRDREAFTEPLTPAPPPAGVPQPPLPEERSEPIARVMPMEGMVSVRLKNNTNAIVSYEAVGHTQRRFLAGGEEVVLQNLPTPVTITTVRQDEGLVRVASVSTPKTGMLEVSLQEETTLDDNQGVLRIQDDGEVFLN
jgi:hypothetical protein